MTDATSLRYRAFLLGPSRYDDPDLPASKSAGANVAAMRRFLVEGPFAVALPTDVMVCRDEPGVETKSKLANWFASAAYDEALVFYFTGHGVPEVRHGTVFPLPGISTNQLSKLTPDDVRDFCHLARRAKVFVIIDACRANAAQLDVSKDLDHVYWMLASFTSAVDDSDDPSRPSPFTAALIAALSEAHNDTDSKVRGEIVRRGVTPTPVIRHASWELDEVPLRKVTATFSSRQGSAASSSRRGGWGTVLVGLALLVGCIQLVDDDSGRTRPTTTTAVASAGPTPTAALTTTPSTVVAPRANTMAAMDLLLARPIVTPTCDGRWVVQLAAIDADDPVRAASAAAPFVDAGADYTFAPLGCGPLPTSGDRYVVFFGAYATDTEARSACAVYGQECFIRRLA